MFEKFFAISVTTASFIASMLAALLVTMMAFDTFGNRPTSLLLVLYCVIAPMFHGCLLEKFK